MKTKHLELPLKIMSECSRSKMVFVKSANTPVNQVNSWQLITAMKLVQSVACYVQNATQTLGALKRTLGIPNHGILI